VIFVLSFETKFTMHPDDITTAYQNNMTKEKLDKFWLGLLLGFAGAFGGFFIFAFLWSLVNETTVKDFIDNVFFNSGPIQFQDKIVSVSMIADILLFYLFMRMSWYNVCKGLLAVVICAVPVVIYLY